MMKNTKLRTLAKIFILISIVFSDVVYASAKPKKHYYIIDQHGNRLMPDSIEAYDKYEYLDNWMSKYHHAPFLRLSYQDKLVIVDSLGNTVIPFVSQSVADMHSGMLFPVYNADKKLGFVNSKNELIVPYGKYIAYVYRDKDFDVCSIGIRKPNTVNGVLWGLISLKTGKEILAPKYAKIEEFENSCAIAWLDGKGGIINKQGKEILPPTYHFRDYKLEQKNGFAGAACFKIGNKHQLIDGITGNTLIEVDYISPLINGAILLAVHKFENGKSALLNKNFELITPYIYDECTGFQKGAQAKKDGISYYINENGEVILSNSYGTLRLFPDKIYMEKPYGYAYYNYDGEKISEERYKIPNTVVREFSYAKPSLFGGRQKVGFKDENGELVIPRNYLDFGNFENDRIIVAKGERSGGVIDINNKTIIPFKYDDVQFTDTGGFYLTKGKKSFFVDENGNRLTEHIYDSIAPIWYNGTNWQIFRHHFEVKRNGKWTIADGAGQEITPFFDKIGLNEVSNDLKLTTICNNGKWGIWNLSTNEEFLPCEYEDIYIDSNNDHIQLKQKGRWTFCNLNGEILTDFRYDDKLSFFDAPRNKTIFNRRVSGYPELVNSKGKIIFKAPKRSDIIKEFQGLFIVETEGE